MDTTLEALIKGAGIYSTIREDWNDNSPAWAQDKRHFKAQLRHDGRSMSIWFYQGISASEPTTRTILECLATEYSYNYGTLEEYISELGYEFDSLSKFREIESTFNALNRQNKRFGKFLPADLITRIQEII